MTKFILGVVVGLFLGASVNAYGGGASRAGTLSGWVAKQNSIVAAAQTFLT